MEAKNLVPNVHEFISKAGELVGRREGEWWAQQAFCDLVEGPVSSPIEQLFYVAFKAMCKSISEPFNPPPELVDGKLYAPRGVYLVPQHKVGKYTVDFYLSQFDCGPPDDIKIVIELDGHAFHDKDKHQRAYEKARDRFISREGYMVLHFTGSEVVKDPFAVAHEALRTLRMAVQDEHNPDDPLECGL